MNFKNKIILITGAASGIGRAAAMAFAEAGGFVIASDINEKGGLETVAKIKAMGEKATFIKTDVAVFEEVKKLMNQIVEQFGRLDIAINNAGINGVLARTVDYPVDDWERVISVNASSVYYCMKTQIPIMLQQGGGTIVNTASIAGLKGLPNSIAYTASKHAVVGMTKTAAMEYARHNIRINAICPVFTISPMFDPVALEKVAKGIPDKLKANVPMKRFAKVEEQVNAMMWLCSEKASFVTGHALPVDGGLTA
ncbi:MAG: SDR family oxidoreductase [Saprospiraceae bacterium]|jgi:NAD(P)-dependent dehydrogenase (short-subunit alcohol dehydrogenase family)|nr:SDR family oxidoreductase [Saprospiraceae bacterium]